MDPKRRYPPCRIGSFNAPQMPMPLNPRPDLPQLSRPRRASIDIDAHRHRTKQVLHESTERWKEWLFLCRLASWQRDEKLLDEQRVAAAVLQCVTSAVSHSFAHTGLRWRPLLLALQVAEAWISVIVASSALASSLSSACATVLTMIHQHRPSVDTDVMVSLRPVLPGT
jgi:hypothetical protein